MKSFLYKTLACVFLLQSQLHAEKPDPAEFVIPALMFPGEKSLTETPQDLVAASMTFMKQLALGDAVGASSWIPGGTPERPISRASSIIGRLGMKRAYFTSISRGSMDDISNEEYFIITGVFVNNDGIGPFIYDLAQADKLDKSKTLPVGYGRTFFIDLWKREGSNWKVYPIPFHKGVITDAFLKNHTPDENMIWLTEAELRDIQAFNKKTLYRNHFQSPAER